MGFFSPGWIPYSLSAQGMPACSPLVLAARLESSAVSLCPLSAGKMHSETDSPWSAQTQKNLHGLGRVAWEEAFQNTCCSFSQSLPSSSVISLAVLCRELAQFLPTPASSKVCPQGVPVLSLCPCWRLQDYRAQALGRPWCTTTMEETWLGISGTIAPLCLGELRWELWRQLGHMGRLCPKAACLSLQPREAAGVPRATSHSCANSQDLSQLLDWTWQFGTERLPRPLPGLSLLLKRHHFRIQEVCK